VLFACFGQIVDGHARVDRMNDDDPTGFIRNNRKYFDRTVQRWHAVGGYGATRPKAVAIDIDLAGYCGECWRLIYVIEAAETWTKHTAVVRRLGEDLRIPALLVVHQEQAILGARRVGGGDTDRYPWTDTKLRHSVTELSVYLDTIRQEHWCGVK
jgi:hypothetical protein